MSIKTKTGNCLGKEGKFTFCGAEDVPLVSSRQHCMYCSKKWKSQEKKEKDGNNSNNNFKPKKKTGELAMFLEIWQERKHECEHCGRPLLAFKVHYFDHVKPKGSYPELKLDKNNIQLLCHFWDDKKGWYGCHHVKTFEGKTAFDKRKNSFKK
jgi:5-methylcytosine-specific restriction endonuclease McrA